MTVTPYIDRRKVASSRATAIAVAYEQHRGATLLDVSAGRDPRLRAQLVELGCTPPTTPSADLVATVGADTRIIEVKSRGGYGPVSVIERELATLTACGPLAWMYIVWNATQPGPYELWLVQDPGAVLTWVQTVAAQRTPDQPRGTRHEARFECEWADIGAHGVQVDLSEIGPLPPKE